MTPEDAAAQIVRIVVGDVEMAFTAAEWQKYVKLALAQDAKICEQRIRLYAIAQELADYCQHPPSVVPVFVTYIRNLMRRELSDEVKKVKERQRGHDALVQAVRAYQNARQMVPVNGKSREANERDTYHDMLAALPAEVAATQAETAHA